MNSPKYGISLQEAKAVLQPRMGGLAGSLKKAVHEWNTDLARLQLRLDGLGRGAILGQSWYFYAGLALTGDSGVSKIRNSERECFIIDETLTLRIKHVGPDYRIRNYPTSRARAWNAQAPFPTIPPIPRLDFCYRMDLMGTVVEDAMVIYSVEGKSEWRWQVWGFPMTEFAAMDRDMFGRLIYSHDDYSRVAMP